MLLSPKKLRRSIFSESGKKDRKSNKPKSFEVRFNKSRQGSTVFDLGLETQASERGRQWSEHSSGRTHSRLLLAVAGSVCWQPLYCNDPLDVKVHQFEAFCGHRRTQLDVRYVLPNSKTEKLPGRIGKTNFAEKYFFLYLRLPIEERNQQLGH